MEDATDRDDLHSDVLGHRDIAHKLGGNRLQRLGGPLGKPVDGAAVDQRGELSEAVTEGVADGAQADRHVQVLLGSVNEVLPQLLRTLQGQLLLLRSHSRGLDHSSPLVVREHVGHLATVQQVVDVFHKRLVLYLSVAEQKQRRLPLCTCHLGDPLQILAPVIRAVALRDLHLLCAHAVDESCQAAEALPPAPAEANTQHVAAWLPQNTAQTAQVLHCI
mmetsp:Transcript_13243/g.37393  ORF Transcript_13243/g.37393 Transcript_13243/m.37393 type:complete len:219 (+) Transcript_13243:4609-5265(+)